MENCYPCLFCEAVFVNPDYAEDHIKECHSKDKLICNSCSDLSN